MDFIQTIMLGMSLYLYNLIYYLTSISSHPVMQSPSSFFPITPSPIYTPIQHWNQSGPHQSNRYSPSAYLESQSLEPDSDYRPDNWDGQVFAEDLSPLAIDNCQLLPAFKDVFGNDINPVSPTDTRLGPRLRKKKTTKVEAIKSVQNILLDADLTPTLLLLHLLGPNTSNPWLVLLFFVEQMKIIFVNFCLQLLRTKKALGSSRNGWFLMLSTSFVIWSMRRWRPLNPTSL